MVADQAGKDVAGDAVLILVFDSSLLFQAARRPNIEDTTATRVATAPSRTKQAQRAPISQLLSDAEEITHAAPLVVALEKLENFLDTGEERALRGKLPTRIPVLRLCIVPRNDPLRLTAVLYIGSGQVKPPLQLILRPRATFG